MVGRGGGRGATHLLSTLRFSASFQKAKIETTKPKDDFAMIKTVYEIFLAPPFFCLFFLDDNQENSPLEPTWTWCSCGLPSSGWMGALQVTVPLLRLTAPPPLQPAPLPPDWHVLHQSLRRIFHLQT